MIALAIAAVAAAGGIAQWINGKDAAKATAAERAHMEDLVNKLQTPNFDVSQITPEEYSIVQKYVPQSAKVIEQAAPEIVKMNSPEAQQAKSAESDVLQQMQELAQTGQDPMLALQQAKAQQQALETSNSQNQTMDMNAQQRGLGGSGLAMAAQLANNQNAARNMGLQDQQAVADAASRRMQAGMNASGIASNIYNQQFGQEKTNADIMNSFNNALTDRRQSVELANTGATNDASKYNTTASQNVANANTGLANQAKYDTRDYGNDMKQKNYNNEVQKTSLLTGQGAGRIGDIDKNTTRENQAISGIASGVISGIISSNDQSGKKKTNGGGY
jgi:hypothetical protein